MVVRLKKPTRYVVSSNPNKRILAILDTPAEVKDFTKEEYSGGRLLTDKWDIQEINTSIELT